MMCKSYSSNYERSKYEKETGITYCFTDGVWRGLRGQRGAGQRYSGAAGRNERGRDNSAASGNHRGGDRDPSTNGNPRPHRGAGKQPIR